ncbi:hypothetical protein FHX82_007039 [Amycolatopsis bartoniae]|uniref:PucR C-terminal helix-turn-helix domain-containing protein n=1 Tax=Amycolatopsis bartoniae TaxID=941986 RepID=A0A8H9IPN6_9PSEU|nr:helix-turn-helix domain-containing protein [Amycolatopsis bartoniae]MBB2939953.1 hypothetical protein [Amycolatopsis bartoniae]TVT10131.1 hypothetical protein FNH07_05985 [Amycolatopsis bartoniae]GHF35510.1 hypothetical protein GCM10017566_05430 [Amycolatopsis bartoniae]
MSSEDPGVLRIVDHFDRLLEECADLATVIRETAEFGGCAVGFRLAEQVLCSESAPRARQAGPAETITHRLPSGAEVWLTRGGRVSALDAVLLDRLAATCRIVLGRARWEPPVLGDPALVELVVNGTADEVDRSRALKLLGYEPSAPLRVLAMMADEKSAHTVAERLGGRTGGTHLAGLGRLHILTTPLEVPADLAVPVGTHIAVGPRLAGLEAPRSWRAARALLRFTLPSTHESPPYSPEEAVITDIDDVGCFTLLARYLPVEAISEAGEVPVLDALAAEPGGDEMLRLLEVVAATESLRKAAAMLHLHHNSVRLRVGRAQRMLGFDVTAPYGRVRLMLALVLRRLRDSEAPPL